MTSPSKPPHAWPLTRLLSDVIGSGPKSATDMTHTQAKTAFEQLLSNEPEPVTIGAFLLANRWKGNTPEELAAFVDVMQEQSVRPAKPTITAVDCGANYDGKRESALLGVGAGIVSAAAGTPVVVHSGDRLPTQYGCSYKHVLDALGIPTDIDPAQSAQLVDEHGFGYYYQPRFNPGIHALRHYREQMGVRTVINTIETLANPSQSRIHVGSFYHLTFAKKLINTILESTTLSMDRIIMFHGIEGYDDIRPGYTKVAEYQDGSVNTFEIEATRFGMEFGTADLAVSDVAAESATITKAVLAGDRDDQFAEAIVLNAALRLYAGGTVPTIEHGIDRARSVLASGDAYTTLTNLQSAHTTTQTNT